MKFTAYMVLGTVLGFWGSALGWLELPVAFWIGFAMAKMYPSYPGNLPHGAIFFFGTALGLLVGGSYIWLIIGTATFGLNGLLLIPVPPMLFLIGAGTAYTYLLFRNMAQRFPGMVAI